MEILRDSTDYLLEGGSVIRMNRFKRVDMRALPRKDRMASRSEYEPYCRDPWWTWSIENPWKAGWWTDPFKIAVSVFLLL